MFKRMSVVFCGLAVTLMTAGVASAQTATEKTKQAAKDVGANLTDAEITTAVKTKFLADSKVSGLNINVDTNNHVVTLTGPVHSAAEKAEALRLAKTTDGVHSVVSKLTLEPTKTADNDTKTGVKADTKKAAKKTGDAVETGAKKTGDAVETGAKKTGEAGKKVGKETEKVAKETGANITDASITTAVKTKFLADTKVPGLDINVDTNDHIVTLTGTVKSAASKAEAIRLAKTTTGVHSVVDKLTIKP
jgi:hyperosmotically inducible periplasmic protein